MPDQTGMVYSETSHTQFTRFAELTWNLGTNVAPSLSDMIVMKYHIYFSDNEGLFRLIHNGDLLPVHCPGSLPSFQRCQISGEPALFERILLEIKNERVYLKECNDFQFNGLRCRILLYVELIRISRC